MTSLNDVTKLSRRSFLASLATSVAITTLVPEEPIRRLWALGAVRQPWELWGDGIHDDTLALQWRIDHHFLAGQIGPARYRMTQSLIIGHDAELCSGHFVYDKSPTAYVTVMEDPKVTIDDCRFESRVQRPGRQSVAVRFLSPR